MEEMNPTKINPIYRASSTNCCVFGCSNTYANSTGMAIKFYSFPKKPHERERYTRWITAVQNNRAEKHAGVAWRPKPYSRICSQHFIGNLKSNDPRNPSYIPTIFSEVSSKIECPTHSKAMVSEIESEPFMESDDLQKAPSPRPCHRNSASVQVNLPSNEKERSSLCPRPCPRSSISVQVNLPSNENNRNFLFECEFQPNCEVSTLCNIPQSNSNFKHYVDVGVGPAHTENCRGFHGIRSVTSDDQLLHLTGLHFAVFNFLSSMLELKSHGNEKIGLQDRLLLFSMKMYLGTSYSALGVLFGVSRMTAQRIFVGILEELSQKTRKIVFWPSKKVVLDCMPKAFKMNYPNCRVIIDCTEISIQQPSSIDNRIFTFSHYKGTFTAKFLIGITPSGYVSFVSNCYGGRASDSFITNDCGLLDLLEKGDLVLADKGFPGVKCEDVIIVMPPFLHDGRLTEEEVERTYNVASLRIHVERAIQRVKTHGILHHFTNDLLPMIDDIVFMCCVLANLQPPIINEKS